MIVTGRVRADARAPSGFELDVEDVEIVHRVPESAPYPITPKEHGVDFLMEHRHLWFRSPRQAAILRVRATIMRAAQEYFDATRGYAAQLTDHAHPYTGGVPRAPSTRCSSWTTSATPHT